MKRILFTAFVAGVVCAGAKAEVNIDECLASAYENYPSIKKYDLLNSTQVIDLADINRGWLPKLAVYAQGTLQNVVPSFPSSLSNVMQQMGSDIKGLGKFQYKIGLDIQQTIWDGGASKTRREIVRSRTEVSDAALKVELYSVRQRVETLYFGILLLNEQIEQNESAEKVFESNLRKLQSMVNNGVAMQSDADMVEAQLLVLQQQLVQARSAMKGYREMLSIFTGMDLSSEQLLKPSAKMPEELSSNRPELNLFNSRMALNSVQKNLSTVGVMPKIGLFAQTYYGYPGIDYFKAMMLRELSFNIVAGLKVSWNIDAFYNKKSSVRKLDLANEEIDADRETFIFNTRMQTASEMENIRGLEAMMKDDARIVELRKNVRKAAESQLANGIIDATALITKINDETQARLTASYHSIQHIQAIFNLKSTINR